MIRYLGVFLLFIGTVWMQADHTPSPNRAEQIALPPTVQSDIISVGNSAGEVVMIAFISIQNDPTARSADPSRAQLLHVKSLARQYDDEGLDILVVAVDASAHTDVDTFVSDWGLRQPLLSDNLGEWARAYGVTQVPTTLLKTEGRVLARWEGVTRPAELAFAVRRALVSP